jgi:hypothetical protein
MTRKGDEQLQHCLPNRYPLCITSAAEWGQTGVQETVEIWQGASNKHGWLHEKLVGGETARAWDAFGVSRDGMWW